MIEWLSVVLMILINGFALWNCLALVSTARMVRSLDVWAVSLGKFIGLLFIGVYFWSFFYQAGQQIPLGPFWKSRLAPLIIYGFMFLIYWAGALNVTKVYRMIHTIVILLFSTFMELVSTIGPRQQSILDSGLSSWDGAASVLVNAALSFTGFGLLVFVVWFTWKKLHRPAS